MIKRSHMRPSYCDHHGDPVRWLLAAVVYRAIRDCSPNLKLLPEDRASAEWFLSGEEGRAWLRTFGIPDQKARAFVHKVNGGA